MLDDLDVSTSDSTTPQDNKEIEKLEVGDSKNMLIPRLAQICFDKYSFAKDVGRELHYWKKGVYLPNGGDIVQEFAIEWLSKPNSPLPWSSARANDLQRYITIKAPFLLEQPYDHLINLINGVYDTSIGMLGEHNPNYRTTVQLPIEYHPEADCPGWKRFASEVLPKDAQDTFFEIMALMMTPVRCQQKAVLLLGHGKDGKSTFTNALTSFLGDSNVEVMRLHYLLENRFASANLKGRLACVCQDLSSVKLKTVDIFKSLTGGDSIMGEYKNGASFSFRPFVKLIIFGNRMPESPESSDNAWYRRFYTIPFAREFEDDPEVGREWKRLLSSPRELSGALNLALAALDRVQRKGLTETPSMESTALKFRQLTDPLSNWLDEIANDKAEGRIYKVVLYTIYKKYAIKHGETPVTQNAFSRILKKLRPQIGECQMGPDKLRAYTGIELKEENCDI